MPRKSTWKRRLLVGVSIAATAYVAFNGCSKEVYSQPSSSLEEQVRSSVFTVNNVYEKRLPELYSFRD